MRLKTIKTVFIVSVTCFASVIFSGMRSFQRKGDQHFKKNELGKYLMHSSLPMLYLQ